MQRHAYFFEICDPNHVYDVSKITPGLRTKPHKSDILRLRRLAL
jgi:hypothetical protein